MTFGDCLQIALCVVGVMILLPWAVIILGGFTAIMAEYAMRLVELIRGDRGNIFK